MTTIKTHSGVCSAEERIKNEQYCFAILFSAFLGRYRSGFDRPEYAVDSHQPFVTISDMLVKMKDNGIEFEVTTDKLLKAIEAFGDGDRRGGEKGSGVSGTGG